MCCLPFTACMGGSDLHTWSCPSSGKRRGASRRTNAAALADAEPDMTMRVTRSIDGEMARHPVLSPACLSVVGIGSMDLIETCACAVCVNVDAEEGCRRWVRFLAIKGYVCEAL